MNGFLLHQLTDSAFPTGGFAHSGGLEAARALGLVVGARGLEAFAVEALWAAGTFSLPFASAAHDDPCELVALDLRCDASTPGQVANRASRAQGQALLRAASAVLGGEAAALAERVRRTRGPGHLAPVHGAVWRIAGASRATAQEALLFHALRAVISAGVRLGLAGPLEAQAIQARLAGEAQAVVLACAGRRIDEVAQPNPLLDLAQSHQDRLYSRLFQS